MFAIITFRHTGPIKTWSDMRAANVHNARTKPIDHGIEGAPPPEHLIGSRDLVADVKRQLRGAKIDPDRLRKNGVIAYEAILSASADFFDRGSAPERAARLSEWKAAQVAWALDRYGHYRVASMVLHVDEKTPHIHLVVVPLEVKSDKRRNDRDVRWSLVGRTISGPGRFDDAQDAYAAAMERFALIRGVRGSGRKHEPVPVYVARMAANEAALNASKAEVLRETEETRRTRAAAGQALAAITTAERELRQREREFEQLMIEAERLHIERWDALDRDRAAFTRDMATAAAAGAHHTAQLDQRTRQITADQTRLQVATDALTPTFERAHEFLMAMANIAPEDMTPRARETVKAIDRLKVTQSSMQQARVMPPAFMPPFANLGVSFR